MKRLLIIVTLLLTHACANQVLTFEIPAGYTGWVKVQFAKSDCGNLKKAGRTTILVGADGAACTSLSRYPKGWSFSKFYYVQNGRRTAELRPTGWGEGGMIWAESTETDGHEYRFFIGTEKQLNDAYKARASAIQPK